MADEPQYLYLTTTGRRSGLAREIEIWFTRREDGFYLISEHGERSQWVRNLRADPRVRWRVGEAQYQGTARVLDSERNSVLREAVQAHSRKKYGWGDGLVVELIAEV